MPCLLQDVVIACETGSGKTLAYVAPLVTLLCGGRGLGKKSKALILCPNKMLCEQVIHTASQLVDLLPDPSAIGVQGLTLTNYAADENKPAILVATPAGFLKHLVSTRSFSSVRK
jgi:superfamily II DNA/RNA helicase